MLVQHDWVATERQTYRHLLQKGIMREQRPPRHRGEHHPEQHPDAERIGSA